MMTPKVAFLLLAGLAATTMLAGCVEGGFRVDADGDGDSEARGGVRIDDPRHSHHHCHYDLWYEECHTHRHDHHDHHDH